MSNKTSLQTHATPQSAEVLPPPEQKQQKRTPLFSISPLLGHIWTKRRPLPNPAPKRPAPTTFMMVARSNATTDNSLPPNGCERQPQTQMASKRVCRRPAIAALGRLLYLCAQNFCLVSCVVKTNQLEAIAPILLTEKSFSCGLRTIHITQSLRSSIFKPLANV